MVSQRIVAHGALHPVQTVTIGSQVSGMIEDIRVDFNSRVERGQVLAQIDPSTFEAAMRSAEAELAASEASLELARLQWQRINTLRENQVVPPSEVDQATANLRQAEAQLTVRQHALERAQRELDRGDDHRGDGIGLGRALLRLLSRVEGVEARPDRGAQNGVERWAGRTGPLGCGRGG